MNFPKAIVLFSNEGDHAGFMLLAPISAVAGDCVFMLSPVSTEGIESKLGLVVSKLKIAGEHNYVCHETAEGLELTVRPAGLPEVSFLLNRKFEGEVFTEFDGCRTLLGTAQPANRNES